MERHVASAVRGHMQDWLVAVDQRSRPVAVIGQPMVARTAQVAVYDLTVQGPEHNFVADGWLVHNKSPIQYDRDNDGWADENSGFGGPDCDDTNPDINPGATEVCDDAVDNDCDDLIDGSDPDCGGAGDGARRASGPR